MSSWRCNYCEYEHEQGQQECENCGKPKGWEDDYEGPEEADTGAPDAAERAEQQDKARRLK